MKATTQTSFDNLITEKDQDRLQEIMEAGEDDVNRSAENHAYRLENYVRDMNPQKAIGFDYDKGIPSLHWCVRTYLNNHPKMPNPQLVLSFPPEFS